VRRTTVSLGAWLVAVVALACSCSAQDEDASAAVCSAGQSIACVGQASCQGFQTCKSDGSGYDPCQCAPNGAYGGWATGGARTSSTQYGYGGSVVGSSGGIGNGTGIGGTKAIGGGNVGGAGTSSSSAGVNAIGGSATASLAGSTANATCAPSDMAGYSYPTYKPARRLFGSCSEQDVQDYYADCYVKGSCTAFLAGGSKAACGACLAPTSVDAAEYGPLLRLGSPTSPLDVTNMAGCIELMGEADCAKKMMISSLCEFYACSDNCPATDSASYQSLMTCMMNARSTACTAAQSAAVCIKDSAHVAACSGSGFDGQFFALARVFCVQTH
jgi:hypothetical protein